MVDSSGICCHEETERQIQHNMKEIVEKIETIHIDKTSYSDNNRTQENKKKKYMK